MLVRGDRSWTLIAEIDGEATVFPFGAQVVWLDPGREVGHVEIVDSEGNQPPNCSDTYAVGRSQPPGSTTTTTIIPGAGADI